MKSKKNNFCRQILFIIVNVILILSLVSCNKNFINVEANKNLSSESINVENKNNNDTSVDNAKNTNVDNKITTQNIFLKDGYELEEVVILSRHNIRSPLSGGDSIIATMTPHKWIDWSSKPSDLSLRGGALETMMGLYFRKSLENARFFEENYDPKANEVRFYANSKQRTIATANYFLTGLLPISNMDVEYHMEFDKMDPVFNPVLINIGDEFSKNATNEIHEMFNSKIENLSNNYKLLEDVIDVKESKDYKENKFTGFKTDDTKVSFQNNKEPMMAGSLKTACSLSDALVLQYYEGNDEEAAFGKKLSMKDLEDIAEIKDVYEDVLFAAPLVATNVAHPLLKEISSELNNNDRKFTFLCGHDSNVVSVLTALKAEEYELPYAIEKKTPIGCKLVFCKWRDENDKEYISMNMVYQKVDQLRRNTLLDLDNPPAVYTIKLKDIKINEDGLYDFSNVINRFERAVGEG